MTSTRAPRQPRPARAAPATSACCTPSGRLRPKGLRAFAPLFKALADGTRLEILGLLAARDAPLCACELEAHFDLSQPTMSHHLRILREAGLVHGERRGTWVYFAIASEAVAQVAAFAALIAPDAAAHHEADPGSSAHS